MLTYRTTRIINFSYGAMGTLGGGLAAGLAEGQGWNWGQAAVVGIAAGVVIGAVVERFVIRRFANAPRLVLTVATSAWPSCSAASRSTCRPGWAPPPSSPGSTPR